MRNLICATAGALAIAGFASADQVDMAFTGAGAGAWVTVVSPGYNGDLYAGQINVDITNSTGINLDGSWITFCSDLYQAVNDNFSTYDVLNLQDIPNGSPMGAMKAQAIKEMYYAAAGQQYTNDNDFAGAFQLAIWEIVYDYSGGPKTAANMYDGLFQATNTDSSPLNGAMTAALNYLFGAIGSGNRAQLLGLGSADWQDQIIEVPGPGVLSLGGLSLLLAGRGRRRA